ncbi:MAG TPA: hypothetical protein VF494_01190 [Candidatus Limnocylindrales bacterium]
MTWLDELEPAAPGPVAAFRGIEARVFLSVRREVRRLGGHPLMHLEQLHERRDPFASAALTAPAAPIEAARP